MASGDGTGSATSKSTEPRTLRSLEDLRAAPYNPRTIEPAAARGLAASLETFGDLSGIVWNARTGHLVAGHQRVDQLRKLGAVLEVGEDGAGLAHGDRWWPIRIVEWDDATEKAANVTANNPKIAGEFTEALAPLLADVALVFPKEIGESIRIFDLVEPALPPSPYTRKLVIPIYSPKGDRPRVSDLFSDTKTRELLREIDRADVPEDVRSFLRRAAERHTRFHFQNIAEFYAHAEPSVQRLMEASALVLIDFNAAIEKGFVRLTERLGELADGENFTSTTDGEVSHDS